MIKLEKTKKVLIMLAAGFVAISSCGLNAAEFPKCNCDATKKERYNKIAKIYAQLKKQETTHGAKLRGDNRIVPEKARHAFVPEFFPKVMNSIKDEVGKECYADLMIAVDEYIHQGLPDVSLREYIDLFVKINAELMAMPEYSRYNCKGVYNFKCNGVEVKPKSEL